jgi:undecaprenyl-diphosphatase
MALFEVVLLAAVQGLAEVLPISRSGHGVVAGIWLAPGRVGWILEGLLHLATLAALCVAARRRLSLALGDGVRAIARPSLFRDSASAQDAAVLVIAASASLLIRSVVRPFAEAWGAAPIATGLGLIGTGLSLATIRLAPRPHTDTPALSGALLVGSAHGLSVLPGASGVGVSLTLLLWLGVRPYRAIDTAFLITAPTLLVSFVESAVAWRAAGEEFDLGTAALGLVVCFVAATAAVPILKSLLYRRWLSALALWIIPLGLATIAYGQALPDAAEVNVAPARGSG